MPMCGAYFSLNAFFLLHAGRGGGGRRARRGAAGGPAAAAPGRRTRIAWPRRRAHPPSLRGSGVSSWCAHHRRTTATRRGSRASRRTDRGRAVARRVRILELWVAGAQATVDWPRAIGQRSMSACVMSAAVSRWPRRPPRAGAAPHGTVGLPRRSSTSGRRRAGIEARQTQRRDADGRPRTAPSEVCGSAAALRWCTACRRLGRPAARPRRARTKSPRGGWMTPADVHHRRERGQARLRVRGTSSRRWMRASRSERAVDAAERDPLRRRRSETRAAGAAPADPADASPTRLRSRSRPGRARAPGTAARRSSTTRRANDRAASRVEVRGVPRAVVRLQVEAGGLRRAETLAQRAARRVEIDERHALLDRHPLDRLDPRSQRRAQAWPVANSARTCGAPARSPGSASRRWRAPRRRSAPCWPGRWSRDPSRAPAPCRADRCARTGSGSSGPWRRAPWPSGLRRGSSSSCGRSGRCW